MTHIDFLENLKEQYLTNLELAEKIIDKEVVAFYKGMIYAYDLAIVKLKKGAVDDCD